MFLSVCKCATITTKWRFIYEIHFLFYQGDSSGYEQPDSEKLRKFIKF